MDVDELNIRNVDLTRVLRTGCVVDVEVALIQHNWRIRVLNQNILVGDIVNVSVSDIRACPSLETRAVLAVEKRNVFHPGVGDEVLHAGILADGAHGYAVCAIAPEIFDEDIGCVGFGGEAVVADVDAGVGHGQTVDVEGVEAVGILREGLRLCQQCI